MLRIRAHEPTLQISVHDCYICHGNLKPQGVATFRRHQSSDRPLSVEPKTKIDDTRALARWIRANVRGRETSDTNVLRA
jgi:hypothetical protein